jgi:hypothetical protein
MWPQQEGSVDWNANRNLVERNYTQRILEERRGFSDKEVMPITSNSVIPSEVEVRKRGVFGKLKLAFSFIVYQISIILLLNTTI